MSQTTYSLAQLNAMDAVQFVQALGGIYEHSPWVAEQAAAQRPFASTEALTAAMRRHWKYGHVYVYGCIIHRHVYFVCACVLCVHLQACVLCMCMCTVCA